MICEECKGVVINEEIKNKIVWCIGVFIMFSN